MEIRAEKLEIAYGDYLAVRDMEKGKITTIIGPNGSGKSTVLKALTRLLSYRRGAIYLDARSLRDFSAKELARHIGVLPQFHSAPPDFQVKDLVSYGRMPYQRWYERCNDEDQEIIDWAMKATGVWNLREKSINECSGGESQRVWIATVLTQQPEILFLDEPTTYLDIAHQQEMMRLVKKLNRESGIGVGMVLHDLSHAMEVSDWVVVIKDGQKYDEGRPEDVITARMMRDVYDVDCDIITIPEREKPLIAYREIS
mgnify:FL=1